MKPWGIRLAVFTCWLAAMLWLVRYEAFPEFFTHMARGYQRVIPRDMLVNDSWMVVKFKGVPVGYSHANLDTHEQDPVNYVVMESSFTIMVNLMGERRKVELDSQTTLDMTYRLQKFTARMNLPSFAGLPDMSGELAAFRRDKDNFHLVIRTSNSVQKSTIQIPDDLMFLSPVTHLNIRALRPGQELRIQSLNPITMARPVVTIRAVRMEPVTLGNRVIPCTRIETDHQGLTILSWLDAEGNTVRQETPFGWTAELSTPEEAANALFSTNDIEDIMTMFQGKPAGGQQ